MGLKIYSHCDLDLLGDLFCKDVYNNIQTENSLFRKEFAVVPSSGMSAWLMQKTAQHSEIAGNLNFPFINAVVSYVLSLAFPDSHKDACDGFSAERNVLSREKLTWKIFKELRKFPDQYPLFYRYFKDEDNQDTKLFQLSEALASVLDSYQIYAPELLEDNWDGRNLNGGFSYMPDERTPLLEQQKKLYQQITGNAPGMSYFLSRFIQGDLPDPVRFKQVLSRSYKRLTFFGFSAMPRIY